MTAALDPIPMTESEPIRSPLLSIKGVTKRFRSGPVALSNLSLSIEKGSFVSLLGASGCGKSTVLKIIAGLAQPSAGTVEWAQDQARVSFVFQDPTLMPWATAAENVRLPLDLAGVPPEQGNQRAVAALTEMGLAGFEAAYPRQLSGGMKMRVSLARALVTRPSLLLLDEPFAALDEITRFRLNDDLSALWRSQRFTAIFVTHSVFEAVYLAQRVVVMAANPGRVFADLDVATAGERNPAFRTSPAYVEMARVAADALKTAMNSSADSS